MRQQMREILEEAALEAAAYETTEDDIHARLLTGLDDRNFAIDTLRVQRDSDEDTPRMYFDFRIDDQTHRLVVDLDKMEVECWQ